MGELEVGRGDDDGPDHAHGNDDMHGQGSEPEHTHDHDHHPHHHDPALDPALDPAHDHVHPSDGHAHRHTHGRGWRARAYDLLVPHSHGSADAIDGAWEASAAGVRAVRLSLVVLGVTAGLQVAVVAVSGSVALLADSVHNVADALTAVPLWIAFVLGRRPPSRRYTFGLGRTEDLAGLFVVAMIAVSAVVAGVESARRLVEPQPLTHLGWVLAAGLIGFVGNELVAVHRIRVGRRIGSAALVADGVHARTDGFTSLAVVLGVVAVWAGFPLADPIIGLAISLAIGVLLVATARDIGRRLLDGVDPALAARVEQTLTGLSGVVAVIEVRVRWVGHRLGVEATVATDPAMTVQDFHALEHLADDTLRHGLARVGWVRLQPTVHTDRSNAAVAPAR